MVATGRRLRPAESIRALLLTLLVLSGWSGDRAHAQTVASPVKPQAAEPTWNGTASMPVPGGTAALLAAAGLDPSRPRAMALLDIIRAVHRAPEGIEPALDERRAGLVAYLETIAQFERARLLFPNGAVTLTAAENKTTRKALEELAKAVGSSLDEDRRVYRLVPDSDARADQRRALLTAAGLDVLALQAALNKGDTATIALKSDEVPLPLPEAVWKALPGRPDTVAGTTMAWILADRRASLLYVGSFSMDDETRRYVAATPALAVEIYGSDRFGTVALYGRSLRVRDGRIVPPGGQAAVALWEAVADERVTRPDRFILKVLEKDDGRLALLYDAVAHLDAPRQAYALGLWMTEPGRRMERFKALYAACAAIAEGWSPAVRPFSRALYDPAQLLLMATVEPDGRPGPLDWRRTWEKVFESDELPDRPENDLKNLERDGVVDAAWMLETVLLASNRLRRERSEAWLFGHRVFYDASAAGLPQVLVALRGYGKFRSLGATLERMGITDPAVYAAASRQAQRIAVIGDRDRTAMAHALYQGALVLIERARLSRVIDVAAAGRLVASLSRLELSEGGEFLGGVAFWLDAEYLRTIGRTTEDPGAPADAGSVESQVLGAFAGRPPAGRAGAEQTVEYEGIRYRVDPSVFELARLRAVREKQGGTPLDAEMAFAREVQAIASGMTDISKIPARVTALKSAAAALLRSRKPADGDGSDLSEAVADAASALSKIKKPKDLAKAERIAVPLRRVIDRDLSRVLPSLAYAWSIGDPEGTALMAGDPSVRHDWGLLEIDEKVRVRAAWAIPAESREGSGRWRVTGSLLALDVALADQALRRLSAETQPDVPTITENDRQAFAEAVVLANTFDYRDVDMAALADAIRRGRARVAVLASVPTELPDVAASAALDELREQAVAWALAHERDAVPGLFSLGDLLRVGQVPADSLQALDAWGTSGLSFDGRLCLRFPLSQPWSTLSGRRGKGITPTLVPDLALLVAEALSDQRLPAALTRSILAVATLDYLDRLRVAFEDDWMAMVAHAQRTVAGRVDDYLASVMTGGPLVPAAKGANGGRVQ